MWLLDALRDLGSTAGLIAAYFLVRDKLFHEWPLAFFVRAHRMPGSQLADPALRVVNQSKRQLVLGIRDHSRPSYFSPALGRTADDILAYLEPGLSTVVLDAGEARDLLLVQPPNFDALSNDAKITAEIHWRHLDAIPWWPVPRWRAVRRYLSKADLEVLRKGRSKIGQ